jgi:hypothetical protein
MSHAGRLIVGAKRCPYTKDGAKPRPYIKPNILPNRAAVSPVVKRAKPALVTGSSFTKEIQYPAREKNMKRII